MDLQLSTSRRGSFTVVTVEGDVDLGTAAQLGDETMAAIREDKPHLVLDLSGVTFLDSSGLKVLVSTHRRTEQAGGSLALAAVPRVVMRVLTVTSLDKVFPIYDSVDDVVAAAPEDS